MSVDHVFSVAYWLVWALWLIPLSAIVLKSLKRRKDARDFYSISTFFFLILMLTMRAITLIPIFLYEEDFNNYDSVCEETVFAGTPILLFNIAILIHTFRWFKIQSKLISNREPFKYSYALLIVSIFVILSFIPFGYCLYCIDNDLVAIQELFDYMIGTCHWGTQIVLIVFNIYLFVFFTRELKGSYPILYSQAIFIQHYFTNNLNFNLKSKIKN